jgi:hypothetical protein
MQNLNNSKIVILSFQRSGTFSLSRFLTNNGLAGIHHITDRVHSSNFKGCSLEEIQKSIKVYDLDYFHFSDAPYFMMHDYFDKKYPNSKFILIERNTEKWLKSFRKLYSKLPIDPVSRACISKYISEMSSLSDKELWKISDKSLINMYVYHNLKIKKYFKNRDNLLVLDLEDDQKEDKISRFLGLSPEILLKKEDIFSNSEPELE